MTLEQSSTVRKSNEWRLVSIGDVVEVKNELERNPKEAGFERYLKVEHLDPDSLRIKRWGMVEDGDLPPTFYKIFRKGQVLYPTRNPHLRRTAYADFDGICGEKTLTLEAKRDYLIPELLPFLFQQERFIQHATSMMIGSTNPHIRWRDIASYKFHLPPKDRQRHIAEILWAADKTVATSQEALQQLDALSVLLLEKTLREQNWQKVVLGDLLVDIQYGLSKKAGERIKDSVPVLRIPNVVKGNVDLSNLAWIVLSDEEKQRFAVKAGDILIVRTNGNPDYVGRSIVVNEVPKEAVYASYLIRLRLNTDRVRPAYVNTLLGSNYIRVTLRHEIRSSAGNYNLNTVGIKRQHIPLPSIENQDDLLKQLDLFNSGRAELESYIEQSGELKKTLLDQLMNMDR